MISGSSDANLSPWSVSLHPFGNQYHDNSLSLTRICSADSHLTPLHLMNHGCCHESLHVTRVCPDLNVARELFSKRKHLLIKSLQGLITTNLAKNIVLHLFLLSVINSKQPMILAVD